LSFETCSTTLPAVLPTAYKGSLNSLVEGFYVLSEESTWIERARQGDEAAFAAIYDRYQKSIYSLVYRLMGDSEDAFDITQDVFIKAYKGLAKLDPQVELNLSAWLHRIASNACMDVLRRRKIVRWLPWDPAEHTNITPADDSDEPERNVIAHETKAQVQAVLNKMSDKYRLCLVLREYQEMSCEEIATVMNVSRAAVKSLLFRAREQFREVYEEMERNGGFNAPANEETTRRGRGRKGGRRG
jgi:RNA polymerase sigma-70 factor (ECF subfamily)